MKRPFDTILLDLGGTLDGRGGWRDRFDRLFDECGFAGACSRDGRARAFEYAEAQGKATPQMSSARLDEMVRRHVAWQFEALGAADMEAAERVAGRFIADVELACVVSRRVIATLAREGYRLGVVSNGCGNAAVLCEQYGFSPFLSVVVDSHRVGAAKPDPAIFHHALDRMHADPSHSACVGDSVVNDIEPAKALGLRTFWIAAGRSAVSPAIDVTLETIAELPERL